MPTPSRAIYWVGWATLLPPFPVTVSSNFFDNRHPHFIWFSSSKLFHLGTREFLASRQAALDLPNDLRFLSKSRET
jgi:hypothetical protein